VDFALERTSPQPSASGFPWALASLLLLGDVSIVVVWNVKRLVPR
jgi:hypothetical protein